MVVEKAGYWIALGILALFASNHLAARHEGEVHCLASRSLAAVERVAGDATRFMATAEMMFGRGETGFTEAQTTLACVQTRLASAQAVMAQHEAVFARVEAERGRIVMMQELRDSAICPRQRLRMAVPPLSGDGTI